MIHMAFAAAYDVSHFPEPASCILMKRLSDNSLTTYAIVSAMPKSGLTPWELLALKIRTDTMPLKIWKQLSNGASTTEKSSNHGISIFL